MIDCKCPYCGNPAALATGSVVYPHRKDLASKQFWWCEPCDAYVGCHTQGAWTYIDGQKVISDGTLPLGRLANRELRRAKNAAHYSFDPIWREGGITRREAYALLAGMLQIPVTDCHIGWFDVVLCEKTVKVINEYKANSKWNMPSHA